MILRIPWYYYGITMVHSQKRRNNMVLFCKLIIKDYYSAEVLVLNP